MESVFNLNVLFQILTGVAALLAILMQYKWYDKRTRKYKVAKNIFIPLTAILFFLGIWITIDDNRDKIESRQSLQHNFDSVSHNFDSVKNELERNTMTVIKLDSQITPFILMAKKQYPNLNPEAALSKLRHDYIVKGNMASSYNQKGGVTVQSNSGIINQGGSGNTYHQQINPEVPQRHAKDVYQWFEKNLPSKSRAFTISVYNNDQESMKYGTELADYFKSKGFIMMMSPLGQIHAPYPKEKIGQGDVSLSSDSTWFSVTIYPLY